MHSDSSSLRRIASLIGLGAGLALVLPGPASADGPVLTSDDIPTYESYIKVSGQTPWIVGDSASYASRAGTPAAGSGGIEDFYYTKDTSDSTTVKVNGHALGGADDYLASLNLTTTNVGSVEAGYKRFRTFYDGVGGFFPLSDQFQKLSPEQLHVDRSTFWVAATLNKPDQPVFTLSFHDEIRTGDKDSSEWGPVISPLAVITKGVLVGNALPANTPYIAPNVLLLDEHHDILEAGMKATVGQTTETFSATSDWVDNNDARNYIKYPNSTVIADPAVMVHDDQESRKGTTFKVLNQTETKFTDRLALETGLTYTHVNSENGGSWITPAYSSTANAVYTADTAANIYGGSKLDDYVGNISLRYTPDPNWTADAGFRDEASLVASSGGFMTTTLATGATTTAATNITTANDVTYSHMSDHGATPEFSLEYTGIDRLSLYGSVDDQVNRGYQHWVNPYALTTISGTGVVTPGVAPLTSVFFQQANTDHEDAKLGANWNASKMLTVRAELFRKDHQNRFVGADNAVGTASYGGLYVNGYTFTGVKLSVIFKPVPQLTFSTAYQPQAGNMSVTANVPNGGVGSEVTSGKARGQQIGETINWTPTEKFYVQGSVNVVYSYIQTAYPVVLVSSPANIATPIQNANNNYVSGSALAGVVIDKHNKVELQGAAQRANNFNPQIAIGGQPYGSSYEQESVTLSLKHKFNDRLSGEAKGGFLRLTDPTTGGFTNYHGPLAYVALTYSL